MHQNALGVCCKIDREIFTKEISIAEPGSISQYISIVMFMSSIQQRSRGGKGV